MPLFFRKATGLQGLLCEPLTHQIVKLIQKVWVFYWCILWSVQKLLNFMSHKWLTWKHCIYMCMCVTLLGIQWRRVGWVGVLINLPLLKQSKCKLDLSICVSQTIMRREFKWPGCFSSILTQSWNLQRDDFCVNKKKLCIGKQGWGSPQASLEIYAI